MEVRPKNIVLYERLSYVAIALALASVALNWATVSRYATEYPVLYPMVLVMFFALWVWWVWLIARKRKNWARWTSLVLLLGNLPFMALEVGSRFGADFVAATVYYGICLIWLAAVWVVFTGDAKGWFKPGPVTNVVRDGNPSTPH